MCKQYIWISRSHKYVWIQVDSPNGRDISIRNSQFHQNHPGRCPQRCRHVGVFIIPMSLLGEKTEVSKVIGLPLVIIHFRFGFSRFKNHPEMRVPPWPWKPPINMAFFSGQNTKFPWSSFEFQPKLSSEMWSRNFSHLHQLRPPLGHSPSGRGELPWNAS